MLLLLLVGSRIRAIIMPAPTRYSTASRPVITTRRPANIRLRWSRSTDQRSSPRRSCRLLTVTSPCFLPGFCRLPRRQGAWPDLWELEVRGRAHRPYRRAAARDHIGATRAGVRATARTVRRRTDLVQPPRYTSASAAYTAATCPAVARCTTRRHTSRHTCAGTPARDRFCVTGCSAVSDSRGRTNYSGTFELTPEKNDSSAQSARSASCAPII